MYGARTDSFKRVLARTRRDADGVLQLCDVTLGPVLTARSPLPHPERRPRARGQLVLGFKDRRYRVAKRQHPVRLKEGSEASPLVGGVKVGVPKVEP